MKINQWFGNTKTANIHVVTDNQQLEIAEMLQSGLNCNSFKIHNIDDSDRKISSFEQLSKEDYLIIALSFTSFIESGMNRYFPTFRKPERICCKYVFIRLDITINSFVEGLTSDYQTVRDRINYYITREETCVHVKSEAGTDIKFEINKFASFNHFISENCDCVFLPPSEVYAGIHLGSANGKIVVDLSIGQLYREEKMVEVFGLINKPTTLIVEEGNIVDIVGNDCLKNHLFQMEVEARTIVELGIGLSQMNPTGIIGIDESIYDTCHFGIGDGTFYGIDNQSSIHLDLVLSNPTIILER